MNKEIKVLVFGSTGTGKTSLCNELTGKDQPTSSSARGVTFQSHTFDPIEINGKQIVITDTVGLNEAANGTVSPKDSIAQLIKLLHESKDGYNLLIQVMKAPRITDTLKQNYELFYKKMTDCNVPILLVVTGCENEDPMMQWVDDNRIHFESEDLLYSEIFATCFAKGGRLEPVYTELRQESAQIIFNAIEEYALEEPKKLYKSAEELDDVLKKIWNYFCDSLNIQKFRFEVNDGAYDVMIRVGIPQSIAAQIAKVDILDLGKKALSLFWAKVFR